MVNQHQKDYNKYTTKGSTSDHQEPFTGHGESARKPRRRKSSLFEPFLEQSVAGDTASAGKRRRIQLFGRGVMLMVKYYSCLGWPFKSPASVWQLSQVDETMVPRSRPASRNSNRQDDRHQPSNYGPPTSSIHPSSSSSGGNNGHAQNDKSSRAHSSLKTPLASDLFEDPQSTQMNAKSINCQKAVFEMEDEEPQSQAKPNLSTSGDSPRSSLPKGMSARRAGLPKPWIDTSILDGIDGTPLFNCESKRPGEEESFESIFLQAIRTPLPDVGTSAPISPLEPPLGKFDQEASIDALFQQAIKTPLPDDKPVAQSDIQLKPPQSFSKPPNYSLPRPTAPLVPYTLDHSEKNTTSKAIYVARNNPGTADTMAENKPLGLPSLLDPICLTPMPMIPSLQLDEPSIATPFQETRSSVLPRIPKRYSLRLRSRFGSNKSTKLVSQVTTNPLNQGASERFQTSRNSHRDRRDSTLSMQVPAKTVWSRCSTPLPPLDLPRGRYKAFVPDFPSFDPAQFALSPNFDDEVRVAAAVRLPDGEDDDNDVDDSVYDEDEEAARDMPVSRSAPSLPLLLPQHHRHQQQQHAPSKPRAARALSLRRRSRDGLSVIGLRLSRSSSCKGEPAPAPAPAANASASLGHSMLEDVCNRCRVKLASVWPGSGGAAAVAA
ncbi:hypothetical protein IWX90DRAFT_494323 [Phyllosticta citrichinensis]|uniref:Uncharacterized protein n=1 Tax=Phyllosticta citrichinensis TaxID=1130410 RepID=A0ABR1XIP1_9PEZI